MAHVFRLGGHDYDTAIANPPRNEVGHTSVKPVVHVPIFGFPRSVS